MDSSALIKGNSPLPSTDISCKLSDVAKPTGGSLAAPIDGELTTGGLNDVVEW